MTKRDLLRLRFMNVYWGTRTLDIGVLGLVVVGSGGHNLTNPDYHLQLRALEDITDEDALYCLGDKMFLSGVTNPLSQYYKQGPREIFKQFGVKEPANARVIDYLRSRGYLLPFMEYSTEDLERLGWVKIKNS